MRRADRLIQVLAALSLASGVVLPTPGQAGRDRELGLESRHLEDIPDPGACDVVITPANQASTLPLLNNANKRVFCVNPGDYRGAKNILLRASGTSSARRYLRHNTPFPATWAVWQSASWRAVFHSIEINDADWWVIEGLTIQPNKAQTQAHLLGISGGGRNVVEGNLIDASIQPNTFQQVGVNVTTTGDGVSSTYNSIQNNVIRGGNVSRLLTDYAGVSIRTETIAGANNDYNKVVSNEIYDWGDGVAVSSSSPTCNWPGQPYGTIIDNNDIYITPAKYVRCHNGVPDPNGDCSCSENGIDVKPSAASTVSKWTQITNNRLWGFRPTLEVVPSCGGSGSNGQAIAAGNVCAGHVFVAQNIITDSTIGIQAGGSDWTVVGNVLSEIRQAAAGNPGLALFPLATISRMQFNTVVGVDNAYNDAGSDVSTKCNVVIDDLGITGPGGARGANHVTAYNHSYAAATPDIIGSTNKKYSSEQHSRNVDFCFIRKRWTGPEQVCIPFGMTTSQSPHAAIPASCSTSLGSAFGYPVITYP